MGVFNIFFLNIEEFEEIVIHYFDGLHDFSNIIILIFYVIFNFYGIYNLRICHIKFFKFIIYCMSYIYIHIYQYFVFSNRA